MYKSQALTKEQIQSVVIPKEVQDYVMEHQKNPIDLVKGFEILKQDSENFTKDDLAVQQTDHLFHDIVVKYSKDQTQKTKEQQSGLSKEAIRIRQEQQQMELELLALELELAA